MYDCDSIDESSEYTSEYTSDETIDESSDEYYVKTSNKCYRCGRKGHYASRCYAKKHISGKYLSIYIKISLVNIHLKKFNCPTVVIIYILSSK